MTSRTWLFSQLIEASPDEIGSGEDARVFAKKSMTSSKEEHPYVVYKLGNNTAEYFSEEQEMERQFVQIFVHDYQDSNGNGDYILIDKVIKNIKTKLKLAGSSVDGVFIARYLETSQDLNDETLNTVMKYIRFQLIQKGV